MPAGKPNRHWVFTDNGRKLSQQSFISDGEVVSAVADYASGSCICCCKLPAAARASTLAEGQSHRLIVRYVIYQHERGESGTDHNQGYLELCKPQRLSALRSHLRAVTGEPSTSHFEPRRGSRDEAKEYCRKERPADLSDGERVEIGEWAAGGQGQRQDLRAVQQLLDGGASEFAIASEHFGVWTRHFRAIERYRRLLSSRQRRVVPTVELWLGEPGSGKSRAVHERVKDMDADDVYWKPVGKWWCGYEGQKVVILDDFKGWLQYSLFLRILDRYPTLVETKGGMANFSPETIYITSSAEIDDWYQYDERNKKIAEVKRRINTIHRCGELQVPPAAVASFNNIEL